jgi:hypothetical protein
MMRLNFLTDWLSTLLRVSWELLAAAVTLLEKMLRVFVMSGHVWRDHIDPLGAGLIELILEGTKCNCLSYGSVRLSPSLGKKMAAPKNRQV